mmetsp:Transcript_17285/g.44042  ORF Transcript_17285/g.44042 Transcript_17285/m.44042 type:complete len:107 (+) Transcript_17285:89-409(+)
MCRYGFSCPNQTTCTFLHPKLGCRFRAQCRDPKTCQFSHAPPCMHGTFCCNPNCTFAHYPSGGGKFTRPPSHKNQVLVVGAAGAAAPAAAGADGSMDTDGTAAGPV